MPYNDSTSSRSIYDGRKCKCCFKFSIVLSLLEILYLLAYTGVFLKEFYVNINNFELNTTSDFNESSLDGYVVIRNETWTEIIENLTHYEEIIQTGAQLLADEETASANEFKRIFSENDYPPDEPYQDISFDEMSDYTDSEVDSDIENGEISLGQLPKKGPKLLMSIDLDTIESLHSYASNLLSNTSLPIDFNKKYYVVRNDIMYFILASACSHVIFIITIVICLYYFCVNYVC